MNKSVNEPNTSSLDKTPPSINEPPAPSTLDEGPPPAPERLPTKHDDDNIKHLPKRK